MAARGVDAMPRPVDADGAAEDASPSTSRSSKPSAGRVESIARLIDAAERLGGMRRVGALRVHEQFAVGGMASIHLGWLIESKRVVAVKRLHRHLLQDETFTKMLLDEARLAMQIDHPNVVSMLGVTSDADELLLAMDYVSGASVAEILTALRPRGIAPCHAGAILVGALRGLHAAHEARASNGVPLGIVHRDVTPQNVLLGQDGIPRVVDFGVAKAGERLQSTLHAVVKGKLPYVSPERLTGGEVDVRSDVYSAAVVLWEILTGRPLFHGTTVGATVRRILIDSIPPPSTVAPNVPSALDAVVLRGLARDPNARYTSALEMALAIERAIPIATAEELGEQLLTLNVTAMTERGRQAASVRQREASATRGDAP